MSDSQLCGHYHGHLSLLGKLALFSPFVTVCRGFYRGKVAQSHKVFINASVQCSSMVLAMCWLAKPAYQLRKLANSAHLIESSAVKGWRQLELLVREGFRRQGHARKKTGLGGADDGNYFFKINSEV
ncbi:hypothetical protein PUV44_10340 [Xanthomonas arboricola pv. corylina]|nr:hypothetical protein PUV44_10340 [Xanthomonas arboricola pv. corylina]